MLRLALLAGLIAAAGLPASTAQEKKEPPKKKERIAIAEPKDAAKDPDFGIQGEYVGESERDTGKQKIGAQVVAKGHGEFDVKILPGGLPGDGWDGKTTAKVTAKLDGNTASIIGLNTSGSIGGGKLTLKQGLAEITLMKVERNSKTLGEKPPQGAVVLFGKEGDESNWNNGRLLALSDGKYLTVAGVEKEGGQQQRGSINSKKTFGTFKATVHLRLPWGKSVVAKIVRPGAFKAHVEFRLPWMPNSTGQGRGNSGVYLQDRYECQVLDSFGLSGENNECGGFYTQHKPSVNMCYPPLMWQTYDIEFTPAEFGADGKKTKNGRATVYHNGVKIHDSVEFPKECPGGQKEEGTPGPFQFQDHGDPVIYRNVWVVPVK